MRIFSAILLSAGVAFINARAITGDNIVFYTIPLTSAFVVKMPKSPSVRLLEDVPGKVVKPSPRISPYAERYGAIKNNWKEPMRILGGSVQSFFFEGNPVKSELTDAAVLSLMYRFLKDNPSVVIPDLDNFRVFTIANYDPATHIATTQDEQINKTLLSQARATFAKGKKLYANIVQVGGAGSGHYTVVVIEKNGRVNIINTFKPYIGEALEEPYQYILTAVVSSLNSQKTDEDITFVEGENIRTGIQDSDIGSNSCGIYSFVYWAALMLTQDIDAYKQVTAAASEGALNRYEDILTAASYPRKADKIQQIQDRVGEFGEVYFKNPNAERQVEFEASLREWLIEEVKRISSE